MGASVLVVGVAVGDNVVGVVVGRLTGAGLATGAESETGAVGLLVLLLLELGDAVATVDVPGAPAVPWSRLFCCC